jgi:predicted nucleic acid-binding protein
MGCHRAGQRTRRPSARLRSVAPDLLFAECANILWKKVRRGELTKEEAAVAAQTLEQADITVVPTKAYLAAATSIAIELDHPAYDAVYLAAAEAQGLRYVTADDRLARKVRAGKNRFQQLLVLLAHTA